MDWNTTPVTELTTHLTHTTIFNEMNTTLPSISPQLREPQYFSVPYKIVGCLLVSLTFVIGMIGKLS